MTLLKEYLVVGIGGALGSMLRFGFSSWIQAISDHKDYPWGIFFVNLLGSLVIGILAGIFMQRMWMNPLWRVALIVGVLGGFTTFSSFSLDTVTLLQSGDWMSAIMNITLTLVACLAATFLGLFLARILF
jgi:CrcB protein